MMRKFLATVTFIFIAGAAGAQDAQSLADIRQELSLLSQEVNSLKSELVSTGSANVSVTGDNLQRLDNIEAELTRLTAKTEQLENRINRVVSDGTNRIGDLEFRLVELEGGDLGQIGDTLPLGEGAADGAAAMPESGGGASAGSDGLAGEAHDGASENGVGAAPAPSLTDMSNTDGVELAVSEKADFERAQEALSGGKFREAADQFATFAKSYPGGPLSADAYFLQGQALSELGDWNGAARAYLESFSGFPDAKRAPEALTRLGISLHKLGQSEEGCLMLREVATRYPGSDQIQTANTSISEFGCM